MKKMPLLMSLVTRHRSYLIIVILIIPALPLEWKQQELQKSLVHQKRSMDHIAAPIMVMKAVRHTLLSKIYKVQRKLLRSLVVSVTIKKRVGSRFRNLEKTQKDSEQKENPLVLKLTQPLSQETERLTGNTGRTSRSTRLC